MAESDADELLRTTAHSPLAAQRSAPFPSAQRRRLILIVDDDTANVRLLGQLLTQAGYDVMPALSGEEALAKAEQRCPDLVLLDQRLPGIDGGHTCRLLRERGLGDVPVIFVTAMTDSQTLIGAFEAGAVDYVTKPVLMHELLARVRVHLELRRARERLAEVAQEREDAVQVIAHDLKNPLSAASFAAQMLARGSEHGEDSQALVEQIQARVHEALELIRRYLRRGAEGLRLRHLDSRAFALRDVAVQVIDGLQPMAASRDMQVALSGDAPAWADPTVCERVLQNLLSNAIRYAPPGSTVEVAIDSTRDGHARLRVLDRGPGIAPAERDRLFRSYARLAEGWEPQPGELQSSGLGLAIAKFDTDRMGGSLSFAPRDGGGSEFTVALPQRAVRLSPRFAP